MIPLAPAVPQGHGRGMALPPPLLPMDETAVIDAAAVALGADLAVLMAEAGAAVAREAQRLVPAGPILVACGGGANGGDGYVAARLLAEAGRPVEVWPVVPPTSPLCRRVAAQLPEGVRRLPGPPIAVPGLVIDAVLGAGQQGAPREPVATALHILARLGAPILAVDVPSGIGSTLCLPARRTVCLQAAKRELLTQPGLGEFTTVDIGVPPAAYLEVQPAALLRFPLLRPDAHKGVNGEVLAIGGGTFPGALEFAVRAAVRTGCDLVRAWTADGPPLPPTVVLHRQEGPHLRPARPEELSPLLARASAVLIGPGLGREDDAIAAARQAFSLAWEMGVPMVIDADGIAACADLLRAMPEGDARILLTPHRGEARTLLAGPVHDEAVHAFARRDRVVLLKGQVDLLSDGWRWQHNRRGNPRMAVGGTGDVLAGLAVGLMARGCSSFDAARLAVLWITTAADELWNEQGPCYDALDVIERLPATLRGLLEPLHRWPPIQALALG